MHTLRATINTVPVSAEPDMSREPRFAASITRRRYRYLAISTDDRERPHLVRERVKCGKSTCRCARDPARRHGPYTYFRWERWDTATGRLAYYREYVPASEVVRVRRWIRRYRGEAAQSRGVLGRLRRLLAREMEASRGT
jgi:hypothetical protein